MSVRPNGTAILPRLPIDWGAVEIADQNVGPPDLNLIALQIGVRALSEALFRIEEHHTVRGDPVAKHGGGAKLHRMNDRFRHLLPDLVAGGRMAHQVAELLRPVAGLDSLATAVTAPCTCTLSRRERSSPACARGSGAACG